jgi:hypothetical protein
MEVLEKGDGRKGWTQDLKCTGKGNARPGCGALLRVLESDLFKTTSHARDETTTHVTFRCSECENLTDIKSLAHNIVAGLPTMGRWGSLNGIKMNY